MIDPRVHIVGEGIHKDIQYPGKGELPRFQKDTKVCLTSSFVIETLYALYCDKTIGLGYRLVLGYGLGLMVLVRVKVRV